MGTTRRAVASDQSACRDNRSLAEAAIKLAVQRKLGIATAESCTAGCLATLLADAPGAGTAYLGGFVVYSEHQKTAVLGVNEELLERHTAVSGPVADAMAAGALAICPADIAIAITGVAGPEADDDGNPVGLIYVAVAVDGAGCRNQRHEFGSGTRSWIRNKAMREALLLLEQVLDEMPTPIE